MRHYSARSLKSLKGIHPDLRSVIDQALQTSPVDFIVIEGLRTKERQRQLVDAGASKTMNSRHITGHAVDLLPIGPDGKGSFAWPLYNKLAPAVKEAAKAQGIALEWGGDWRTFKDGPHFQLSHAAYPADEFTPTASPPVERKTAMQSRTVQVTGGQIIAAGGLALTAFTETTGVAQYMLIGIAGILSISALWIMKDRLRKWAEGDR